LPSKWERVNTWARRIPPVTPMQVNTPTLPLSSEGADSSRYMG